MSPSSRVIAAETWAPRARTALLASFVAFAALVISSVVIDRLVKDALLRRERERVELQLAPYANTLAVGLQRRLGRLAGLRAFVESAPSIEAIDQGFPVLSAGLMEEAAGLRAIQLIRHDVITHVYPTAGNEGMLGFNVSGDPRRREDAAARELQSGQLTVIGPFPLVQGGTGIVARQRMNFTGPRPWSPDVAAVVIDVPSLFEIAGMTRGIKGLDAAVVGDKDQQIWPARHPRPLAPVSDSVTAQSVHWTLIAAPVGGWDAAIAPTMNGLRVAMALIGLLLSGFVFLVTDRQARLEWAVHARTAELEQANADLRRQEEELLHAQKMEAVGTLAGGVAHDFNNALTAITGFGALALERALELAHRDQPLPGIHELTRDLEEVIRAAEHAAMVTNQLLAFSRKQMIQNEELEVGPVVRGIEELLRRLLGEGVQLTTKIDDGLPHVTADRGQLTQVIVNLSVNARDAMPDGGPLLLTVRKRRVDANAGGDAHGAPAGDYVELAMTDAGVGMPPDVAARVFEPFFTTKGLGKGTGLGLSTVYGIVGRLQGFISVESAPGAGTTFRILLPALPDTGTAAPPPRSTPRAMPRVSLPVGVVRTPESTPAVSAAVIPADAPAPAADGATTGVTVLVVEDELGVLHLTARILRRAGFTVLEASSAAAALAECDQFPGRIDLMLSDIVMPGMRGPDLALEMRRRRPEMKAVLMSGFAEEADRSDGFDRLPFVAKPFAAADLIRILRETLASP